MFLDNTTEQIKTPRVNIGSYEIIVSAEKFLSIIRSTDTSNIIRTKFLIPELGSNSLGKFLIVYKHEPPKETAKAKGK